MENDLADKFIEHVESMMIGRGYDKFASAISTFPAVVGAVVRPQEGQVVTSGIETISDVADLHENLGIHLDVSASYGGISGSAKMKYAHEFDKSTYSTYVVINVSVQDSFQQFQEPVLHQDAVDLLRTRNADRFHARFGDYFISGISYGGEFMATYEIISSSKEERESVAAEVHAAYNGVVASADLNGSISRQKQTSKNHLDVRLIEFRQGAVTHADLDLDAIKATATQFPVLVRDHPYAYRVKLGNYSSLRLPIDAFDFYQNQKQLDVLADLAKKRLEFMTLRDDLKFMLAHTQDFMNADGSDVDRAELSRMHDDAIAQMNTMQDSASACSRDARVCEFTTAEVAKYTLPVLRPDRFLVPNLIGHIWTDVQTAPEYAQHRDHFNFQGSWTLDPVPSELWGKIASMTPGPHTGPYPKGTRVDCYYYPPSGSSTGSPQ